MLLLSSFLHAAFALNLYFLSVLSIFMQNVSLPGQSDSENNHWTLEKVSSKSLTVSSCWNIDLCVAYLFERRDWCMYSIVAMKVLSVFPINAAAKPVFKLNRKLRPKNLTNEQIQLAMHRGGHSIQWVCAECRAIQLLFSVPSHQPFSYLPSHIYSVIF